MGDTTPTREFTVTFDANGGTGGPEPQTKKYGESLTLPNEKPTKDNSVFLGWIDSENADKTYEPGGVYSEEKDLKLQASWHTHSNDCYETVKINCSNCNGSGNCTHTWRAPIKENVRNMFCVWSGETCLV